MPAISGLTFFADIPDTIKDALLVHPDDGEKKPTDDDIILGNFEKLIVSAMSNWRFLEAPDLDKFVHAISQELHILPSTVIDLICFAIEARGYFKFLDLIDFDPRSSRRVDFLSRYVDLKPLKSLKEVLVAATATASDNGLTASVNKSKITDDNPSADVEDNATNNGEDHEVENLYPDIVASMASSERKINTLMEEVRLLQQRLGTADEDKDHHFENLYPDIIASMAFTDRKIESLMRKVRSLQQRLDKAEKRPNDKNKSGDNRLLGDTEGLENLFLEEFDGLEEKGGEEDTVDDNNAF